MRLLDRSSADEASRRERVLRRVVYGFDRALPCVLLAARPPLGLICVVVVVERVTGLPREVLPVEASHETDLFGTRRTCKIASHLSYHLRETSKSRPAVMPPWVGSC